MGAVGVVKRKYSYIDDTKGVRWEFLELSPSYSSSTHPTKFFQPEIKLTPLVWYSEQDSSEVEIIAMKSSFWSQDAIFTQNFILVEVVKYDFKY